VVTQKGNAYLKASLDLRAIREKKKEEGSVEKGGQPAAFKSRRGEKEARTIAKTLRLAEPIRRQGEGHIFLWKRGSVNLTKWGSER